jgi:hypothetical protein
VLLLGHTLAALLDDGAHTVLAMLVGAVRQLIGWSAAGDGTVRTGRATAVWSTVDQVSWTTSRPTREKSAP